MMELDECAAKYPEIGSYRLSIKGTAFKSMSLDWIERHPSVEFFLEPEEIMSGGEVQVELAVLFRAMERFLSHPDILDDLSQPIQSLRSTYRSLLYCSIADYREVVDARIGNGAQDKDWARLAELYVLALNFDADDPRKSPQASEFWASAGHAFLKLRDINRATRFLEQAIKLDANSIPALSALASTRIEQKRWSEADGFLKKILELEPTNVWALCTQVHIHLVNGYVGEAGRCLKKARAIDPRSPYVLEAEPFYEHSAALLKPRTSS